MKKNFKRREDVRRKIACQHGPVRMIVGSANISYDGWIDTETDILDILKEEEWRYLLGQRKVEMLLSEHVLEHIAPAEQLKSVRLCYRFLKPGGRFRVAVPDGYRPDDSYRKEIMPPRDGHTMVFNHQTLETMLQAAGFQTTLLEYFDMDGMFHLKEWHPDFGMIRRSARFDTQQQFRIKNGSHILNYTSLIVDGVKPEGT